MRLISIGLGKVGMELGWFTPSWYVRQVRGWMFSYGPGFKSWQVTVCGLSVTFWYY